MLINQSLVFYNKMAATSNDKSDGSSSYFEDILSSNPLINDWTMKIYNNFI